MSKTVPFPREKGSGGIKRLGHGKDPNPEKILKYSAKESPIESSVSN
jgi:hypothetical protein